MDGRTDGGLEIPPCVLQDIDPLGLLPKKGILIHILIYTFFFHNCTLAEIKFSVYVYAKTLMVLPSSVLRGTVGTPAAGPGVRTQMLRDTNPSFSIKIELSDIYFNKNSLYVNVKKI